MLEKKNDGEMQKGTCETMKKLRLFYWFCFVMGMLFFLFSYEELRWLGLIMIPCCFVLDYQDWKEEKYGGALNVK
jgi:hypothetical protein